MKYITYLKLLFTLFVILLLCFDAGAQTVIADSAAIKAKSDSLKVDSLKKIRAENIYLELGGIGWFYSLNYDTRFNKRRNGLGLRVGAGYLAYTFTSAFPSDLPNNPPSPRKYFSLPLQLNYLAGKKSHFAEFGAGATLAMYNGDGRSFNVLYPINKPGNQFKLITHLPWVIVTSPSKGVSTYG